MKISIHQPNYIPWIGFFHKMVRCNKFVIFNDVQISNGRTFMTRGQIKTSNGPFDLVIPIQRKEGQLIKDVQMEKGGWREKHVKTIKLSYSKTPYFNDYEVLKTNDFIKELEDIYNNETLIKLCDFNMAIIKLLMKCIGIETRLEFSSDISSDLFGEERIIEIVKRSRGNEYLSGNGAGSKNYITEEGFRKGGIKLTWQNFKDPIYPQLYGEFIPKMSILDLLFNVGSKETYKILTQ